MDGGFYQFDQVASVEQGSALIVFYSRDLEWGLRRIEESVGKISQAIFFSLVEDDYNVIEFGGNELAVRSDVAE